MEDGFDWKQVCLSELAKNSRIHLHKRTKGWLEELAREHVADVLVPTGLAECKTLKLLISILLLCAQK